MKRHKRQENGFTLIEVCVVLALVMILMSCAVVGWSGTMAQSKANSAQYVVMCALRQARFSSITQRRNVLVWINQTPSGPGQVQTINYQVIPAGEEPPQPPVSMPLPQGTQIALEAGVPDTPMAFGNSAPVYIGDTAGGPEVMMFHPTGAFTDQNAEVLNGTIFLGVPGQASTARAVTIKGAIGAVDHLSWTGAQWE